MKSFFVKDLFESLSNDYDKMNSIITFGLHKFIKKNAVSKICCDSPKKILDLCCGTGDVAGILKQKYPTADIIGVDFSSNMLKIAKNKYSKITFLEADCSSLPFENEFFDICTISFGLRNIENMDLAMDEIFRVLKKDGQFLNLDLAKPNKFFNLFLKPYMYIWVALMGRIFHGKSAPYKYLVESNETFFSSPELVKLFEKKGFRVICQKQYLFGQISMQICVK